MSFVFRTLLTLELIMSVTEIQVLYKSTFHNNGVFLQTSGNHHQYHQYNGNNYRQEHGNIKQALDNKDNNSHRKNHTQHNGRKQWCTIETIILPQSLKLNAMILLHHNGSQERRNAHYHEHDIE